VLEHSFSDIGLFYKQETIACLWGREKFGIADISLSTLGITNFEKLVEVEGVQKIRFCLEPSGKFTLTPIFYPEIITNTSICKDYLSTGSRFCEFMPDMAVSSLFCRECIDFNLQTTILRKVKELLTARLKKFGYLININDLSWPLFEYKYADFSKFLDKQFKELNKV